MEAVFILIFIVVLVVILAIKGFKIIQQAETMIIERLGKYHRALESGVNIIWPFLDRPRDIIWRDTAIKDGRELIIFRKQPKIDLREQLYNFPSQNVITKDNVTIRIDALLYFQITDATKSVYEIANLPDAIEKLTQTTLRNVIGEMELDQCLTSRDNINNKLCSILDLACDKWGVKIGRVELQDIVPPQEIQDAMEKQMKAERNRRAQILESEGAKKSQILESEGFRDAQINQAQGLKQSDILKAQGEAEAKVKIAEAEAKSIQIVSDQIIQKGDPINYLVTIRYIDTLEKMVSGKDNKVIYIPYEATGILSSIGSIKNLFDKNIDSKK